MPYISPAELIYRQLAAPQQAPPKAAPKAAPQPPVALTRDDVTAIVRGARSASVEELEEIIAHQKDFQLTSLERDKICLDLSIRMAERFQLTRRREHPSAEFISRTLGLLDTPYGLIESDFVTRNLRDAAQAIQRCKRHAPPHCACWASQRAILWQAQAHGPKTPESWAASRMYEMLEELETSSRPEPEENANAYPREMRRYWRGSLPE